MPTSISGRWQSCFLVLKISAKFKKYQADIVKNETDLVNLNGQVKEMDVVKTLKGDIGRVKREVEELAKKTDELIVESNLDYRQIRLLFSKYLLEVINIKALLSIMINNSGNLEFEASLIDDKTGSKTSASKGNSYKQIMCICLDLAILSHYSNRSYFKFVYHDGSLESLDDRKKLNYIKLVRDLAKETGFQIIFTVIDSDLPYDAYGEKIEFEDSEIAIELTDESDSRRLYGFHF